MKYKENYVKNYLALYVYVSMTNRDAKNRLNKEKTLNYTYNSINPRELNTRFEFYNKAVPTTTVREVEIGHRPPSLHCSITLEGLIIYGLSPRNNDLAQTGNPISSIFLTWFAVSQGIVEGWQFFRGRSCLPA